MGVRASLFAAGAAAIAALASGCSQNATTSTSVLMDTNPSAVCASPETMSGVANILLGKLDLSGYDPAPKASYKDELIKETAVTVDTVVMDSFDKTTRKVSCSGKLTFTWPAAMIAQLKSVQPGVNWGQDAAQADFTIQPDASGNGFVYSLDNQSYGALSGSVQAMLQALAKADDDAIKAAAANALAAKAPPPEPTTNASVDNQAEQPPAPDAGDSGTSPSQTPPT